jgi:hypothetical protein
LIRQAISCDICGSEKKQTNHWFVAHDQGGELRVTGWNSRNRLRPGSKHLCGQTCLHKLVDEFMARCLQARVQNSAGEEANTEEQLPCTNASLTSDAAYPEFSSSARLITPPTPALPIRPVLKPPVELVSMPARFPAAHVDEPLSRAEETPVFMSRQWRAEAWERERERETRAAEHRSEIALRRRSN